MTTSRSAICPTALISRLPSYVLYSIFPIARLPTACPNLSSGQDVFLMQSFLQIQRHQLQQGSFLVLYLIRVSVQLEVPVGGTKCAHEGDALGPFVNRSLKDFVVRPIVLVSKPFMHPLSAGASDCAVLFLTN